MMGLSFFSGHLVKTSSSSPPPPPPFALTFSLSGKAWPLPDGVLRANGVETKWADMAKSEVLLGQESSRGQREPHTAVSSGGRSAGGVAWLDLLDAELTDRPLIGRQPSGGGARGAGAGARAFSWSTWSWKTVKGAALGWAWPGSASLWP